MTAMQNNQPDQGDQVPGSAGASQIEASSLSDAAHEPSFGGRLRAAREARGLSLLQCAQSLKLPARILRQLERDDYEGIDSKVYLASYIGKYARHLGINEASIQVELGRVKDVEPVLVATGGISHSRFLFDRYATAATYVVLTAVIVVPMIWLGVRGTLDRSLTRLTPLDATPVAQQDATARVGGGQTGPALSNTATSRPQVRLDQVQEQPLLASMAPFPDLDSDLAQPVAADVSSTSATESGTGSHDLSLTLVAPSWVEISRANGTRLEYGLLPAGTHKIFHSDQPLDVRIGNAQGARVDIDGKPVPLEDFKHANVAHFSMQVQDGEAAAARL